jgi:hypothetical protein
MWKCNECGEQMPLGMQKDHLDSCPKIYPYVVQCDGKTRYFKQEVEASVWQMQLVFVTDKDIFVTHRIHGTSTTKKY